MPYWAIYEKHAFLTSKQSNTKIKSFQKVCDTFYCRFNNIFIRIVFKLYK